jgi:NADH:ubiquinone oxidoreductase subunit 6 (subunit J)
MSSNSKSREVCPNDDPYFTRTMYRLGLLKRGMKPKEIVETRKHVYYSICIIVRFLIIAIVYYLRDSLIIQLLVLLGAVVGIVNLGSRMTGNQWWSKKFQFIMSVVIAGLVILSFLKKVKSWTIPAAMLFSLVGGILQSFVVGFC